MLVLVRTTGEECVVERVHPTDMLWLNHHRSDRRLAGATVGPGAQVAAHQARSLLDHRVIALPTSSAHPILHEKQLRQRVAAEGLDEDTIGDVLDADNPKQALIALVVEHGVLLATTLRDSITSLVADARPDI